tara:strand:+ start:499 stop:1065 length:567 start_codon:yes stop_codon:yes gene_type:complete
MMQLELLSILDYFIIIILTISIIISFIKGFTQSLLGLLTWIGAAILTLIFYENLSNYIGNYINKISILEKSGLSVIISTILSIPFIFLLSLIILRKLKSFISSDFQKSSLGNFFDKIFGAIYGFIFGFLLISILIIVTNNIFNNFSTTKFINKSFIYPYIENFNKNYLIKYTPLAIENGNKIIEENID